MNETLIVTCMFGCAKNVMTAWRIRWIGWYKRSS